MNLELAHTDSNHLPVLQVLEGIHRLHMDQARLVEAPSSKEEVLQVVAYRKVEAKPCLENREEGVRNRWKQRVFLQPVEPHFAINRREQTTCKNLHFL